MIKSVNGQGNRVTRPTLEPSSRAEGWGLVSTALLFLCFVRNLSYNRFLGLVLPGWDLDSSFELMVPKMLTSGADGTRNYVRSDMFAGAGFDSTHYIYIPW